nr:uncharacterized protein LOC109170604 [Ipomoea batatas]
MYSASSSVSKEVPGKQSESYDEFEFLDLPGVPRQPLQSSADREVGKDAGGNEIASNKPKMESGKVLLGKSVTECKSPAQKEGENFLPFMVPPPKSFMSHSLEQSNPPSSISKPKGNPYFSYPNLFTSQGSNLSSRAQPFNSFPAPRTYRGRGAVEALNCGWGGLGLAF